MKEKLAAIIFSCMLLSASISAVPSSRSLKSVNSDDHESNQYPYHEFKVMKNGRMDIEVADYSGTGANTHHDPIGSPPPAETF